MAHAQKLTDAEMAQLYAGIGQRLRWARELVYDSQAEFARAMGIDKSQLSKMESGQRALSLANLLTAGNKLRTGTDFLLTGNIAGVDRALRILLVQRHPELAELSPPLPQPRPKRRNGDA